MDLGNILIKDFEKLKQLDRVELLLKLERLEKKEMNSYFSWGSITNVLVLLCGYLILLFLHFYNLFGVEKAIVLLRILPPIVYLIIIIFVFGNLYNLINRIKYKKYFKELHSKYFKVEVKKK